MIIITYFYGIKISDPKNKIIVQGIRADVQYISVTESLIKCKQEIYNSNLLFCLKYHLKTFSLKGPNKVSKVIVQANDSPYGVLLWEKEFIVLPEPDGTDFTQEVYITRQQGMMGQLQVAFRYVDLRYKDYDKDIQILLS